MKTLFKILVVVVIAFAAFYVFLIIPNDKRLAPIDTSVKPDGVPEELYFDMTKNMSDANIEVPALDAAEKYLDKYPYKQDYPALHNGPLNLHVSLGWFPLKTVHRDCIFAPAPSKIEYTLTLPENPVLKFDYGIISSVNGDLLSGAEFSVVVAPENKAGEKVFNAVEQPMKPFRWRSYDALYKNFLKYFRPGLEDRDGKWEYAQVDLRKYSREKVTISFIVTKGSGVALSFWGRPCLYSKTAAAVKRPPSVILIVIDSFKRGHMIPEFSPVLCGMAGEGVDFKRAFSNGNNTKLSVYSFMASRYPFEMPETATHYDLSKQEKENFYKRQTVTIPSMFAANGYRSAGIGSVSLFSDGHGLSGDIGFDEAENLEASGYSPPHVTQEAINWLARHGNEKFFLLIYYYGPHGPYRPPLSYLWRTLKTGKYANLRDALYSGDIVYHDDYIKILKEYLQSSPAFKDTVVIVTADHGLAFRSGVYDWPTKYGAWKKKTVWFHSHGVNVTPDDLNVPLIFWNLKKQRVVERKVQLLDLAPTLAELSGIPPSKDFKGQSLLGLMDGKNFSEGVTFHQGVTNYGVYWKDEYLYVKNFMPREGFPKESVIPEEMYYLVNDSVCAKNLAFEESPELTIMRRFFNTFLVQDEENRLVFKGQGNSSALIKVSSEGAIDSVETGAALKSKSRRSFTVALKNGETVSFVTSPRRAGLKLSASIDGKVVKPSGILYGSQGLALNQGFEIKSADRDYYRGICETYKPGTGGAVLFGTIVKDKVAYEDLKNSPKQLKSMLEQWGYIN